MTCSEVGLHLPVDTFNANLRATGRWLDDAVFLGVTEHSGEVGVITRWPDGHIAFLGLGMVASAMIDAVAT